MNAAEREALVRRSIAAWNSDDWEAQLRALWRPDGVIVTPEGWPEVGAFRGWPNLVQEWRRVKGSWSEEHVELESIETLGDSVLAELRWLVRGEASGAPFEVETWILCEFDEGLLSRMSYFLDGEAARSAAEEVR